MENKRLLFDGNFCILVQMTNYELVLIFNPEEVKKETEASSLTKKLLEPTKAKIAKITAWGQRQMAYPIKKHAEGWYLLVELQLDAKHLEQLHKLVRAENKILRHFLVRVNK